MTSISMLSAVRVYDILDTSSLIDNEDAKRVGTAIYHKAVDAPQLSLFAIDFDGIESLGQNAAHTICVVLIGIVNLETNWDKCFVIRHLEGPTRDTLNYVMSENYLTGILLNEGGSPQIFGDVKRVGRSETTWNHLVEADQWRSAREVDSSIQDSGIKLRLLYDNGLAFRRGQGGRYQFRAVGARSDLEKL